MGKMIIWIIIIIILFIAYKKADQAVKIMDATDKKQTREIEDSEKDV